MKRVKDKIELTLKEAETIMDLLFTLESSGGSAEDYEDSAEPLYDKEAKKAGRLGDKLFKLLK